LFLVRGFFAFNYFKPSSKIENIKQLHTLLSDMALQCAVKNMSIHVIDPSTGPGPFFNQEWAAQFEEPSTKSKEQVTQTVDHEEDDYLDYEVPSIRHSRSSKRNRKSFENSFGIKGHKVAKRVKESRAQKKSLRSRTSKTLPVPIKNTCPDCRRRVTCTCAQEEEYERRYERYLLDQYEELGRTDDEKDEKSTVNVNDDQTRCICFQCVENREAMHMHEDEYSSSDDEYPDDRCDCGDCPDCGVPRPHMIGWWGYRAAMIGTQRSGCGVPRPHTIGWRGYRASMISALRW